jgi:hypothetical protein
MEKTLMMTVMFDGFWDRWITHGIEPSAIKKFRPLVKSVERWTSEIEVYALLSRLNAQSQINEGKLQEAEFSYRRAALYYNLIQWLFPETGCDKTNWYGKSVELVRLADDIAGPEVSYAAIEVEGISCFGRVRRPNDPKGCIVILNPIDSTKEELFTYEKDFVDDGWMTVSFDGPGQGETYILNNLKASRNRWQLFLGKVIDYAAGLTPTLPLHLFGTSSGASWALYGGANTQVRKVIAVSPAMPSPIKLPDYFSERMSFIQEDGEVSILPEQDDYISPTPVLLVHGKKDVLVKDDDIYRLYDRLPAGKKLLEYNDEGHCCNFKLGEIRQKTVEWLQGDCR